MDIMSLIYFFMWYYTWILFNEMSLFVSSFVMHLNMLISVCWNLAPLAVFLKGPWWSYIKSQIISRLSPFSMIIQEKSNKVIRQRISRNGLSLIQGRVWLLAEVSYIATHLYQYKENCTYPLKNIGFGIAKT